MPTKNEETLRIRALPKITSYQLDWQRRRDGSLISPKRLFPKKEWFAHVRKVRKALWKSLGMAK